MNEKDPQLVREQYRTTRHEVLLCMLMEFVVWLWSLNKMIDSEDKPFTLCIIGIAFIWMSGGKIGFLMHRCGAFHRRIETQQLGDWGWEHFKPTGIAMAIVAIGASIPQIWYFGTGVYGLETSGRSTLGMIAATVFMIGGLASVVVPQLSKQE